MSELNESYLILSLVNKETIRQWVNNPEMTILDHSSVNGKDFHQHADECRQALTSSAEMDFQSSLSCFGGILFSSK